MEVPFTVEQVRNLYDSETQSITHYPAIMKDLLTKEDTRESDYTPLLPKTIQYIKNNIFHIETGEYYVMQNYLRTRPYTKDLIEHNLYICYMPPLVRKWWSTYATLYQLTSQPTKGLTYIENNIHYLNLTPKKESTFQIKESALETKESAVETLDIVIEEEEILEQETDNLEIAFLKYRVQALTDEEYNKIIYPKELYSEYLDFAKCHYTNVSTMKQNEFKNIVKEIPHFHYECKRYENKSKTNILQPNRQEALQDYLTRSIITLKADKEEQENLTTQALPTLIKPSQDQPPEPIILDSKEESLSNVLTNCKASKYDTLFNF